MPEKVDQQMATPALTSYQQDFVNLVTSTPPPCRFLLASPVGFGKSVAMAAIAKELKRLRGQVRCLVVAPASLVVQWQEQLLRFGDTEAIMMTAQAYRRLQAESGQNENVWQQVSSAVVSGDFLR